MAINFFCKCKKLQNELDEKEKKNHELLLEIEKQAQEIEDLKKNYEALKKEFKKCAFL
jgi:DNA repair exonuclease SbcCD ATPase subunit